MKIDGTVTYGNILVLAGTVLSAGIAWGVMSARQDNTDKTVAAQRVELTSAIAEIKEGMKEQRTDQKELSRKLDSLATDTAFIRGRAADAGTRK